MRVLNKTYQEALALVGHCKIEKVELPQGDLLIFYLKDPAGQDFQLQVKATGVPGLSGNILTLNVGFNINAVTA